MGTEILNTLISEPRFKVYVFGSSLNSSNPRDLDLIFIYDSSWLRTDIAYKNLNPIIINLEKVLPIPIHYVLLSLTEEHRMGFIHKVQAIPLSLLLNKDE
jgi:hypothetical protein